MWIQVRSFDGSISMQVDALSKLTKIEELRLRLVEKFNAPPEKQRLFYRGKQLEDGHTLFDYNVGLNDLVQLMVRQTVIKEQQDNDDASSDKENEKPAVVEKEENEKENDLSLATYKVGDIIDARDLSVGAWFEAKIIKVTAEKKNQVKEDDEDNNNNENKDADTKNVSNDHKKGSVLEQNPSDGFTYHVVFEGYEDTEAEKLSSTHIQPRARTNKKLSDIKIGDKVMVNYNVDDPEMRGFWYDAIITGKRDTRTIKEVKARVFIGPDLMPLDDCKLVFFNEIFETEKPGSQVNVNDENSDTASPVKRQNKPDCDHCLDNPRRKCKFCACSVCGGKNSPESQILCDECDQAFHLQCLNPPLTALPEEDEWYCPECKNDENEIVKAGEKLKAGKKKAKMASATGNTNRDWGKGMACVGRQKVCTVVPSDHFGPIPGIEVGTMWKFRVQVSEAGVHRPHVAGIHGREDSGAFSIVLSGGYEDDKDDGEEFTYTGSGGRDLSGNKRTAEQSCDQVLTRMNKALAKNCNAAIDNKKGACSEDWKNGKPVRVVRNCKGRKHSDYAPEEGNRYDGIYKIVKYWPEKGQSGFLVWRYLLRRDDDTPAPWTKAGKKRIDQLGLTMQYPEGYLEAQAKKEQEGDSDGDKKTKKASKRKHSDAGIEDSGTKKKKLVKYELSSDQMTLLKKDTSNKKLWEEALEFTCEGSQKFLQKVEELFNCICCQEVVFKPVTTECCHNICKTCLQRSFKAEVYNCPMCRTDLQKDCSMTVNKALQDLLISLFPGYEAGRL